jgi:hypothetical protein
MTSATARAAILAAALIARAVGAQAADDPALLRVFLSDGTSLASYGEPALVGDRVVFSMPTAATPNPPLHLVNLPLVRVDWDRTTRYVTTVQATRYIQTQAETDWAALSNSVATTLSDVARTTDPKRRLDIVERARKALADWPQNHYNFRQAEVRQLLSVLDESIADLKAAAGPGRFSFSLSAFVEPPPLVAEPMLPPPTPKDAIEQILAAAKTVDNVAERTSLLAAAVTAIDRDREALPGDWAAATRAETEAAVAAELRIDRSYQALTARTMAVANWRAQTADVRGLERLLLAIPQRDVALGGRRPDAVKSLVAAVEAQLDAARQLQLARDRFLLRAPVLREYRIAIRTPIDLFEQLKPALEGVRALAGSPPETLAILQKTSTRILALASAIVPPPELAGAHALLISATQLASSAAQIRIEAVVAGNMKRAWDASSAAAGALMLGAKARTDIQALLRPPQLR